MLIQLLAQLASHGVPMDLSPLINMKRIQTAADTVTRSLVRTVELRHTPISEVMLTSKNRAIFAEVALKPIIANAVPEAVPVETALPTPNNMTFIDEQLQKLDEVNRRNTSGA